MVDGSPKDFVVSVGAGRGGECDDLPPCDSALMYIENFLRRSAFRWFGKRGIGCPLPSLNGPGAGRVVMSLFEGGGGGQGRAGQGRAIHDIFMLI